MAAYTWVGAPGNKSVDTERGAHSDFTCYMIVPGNIEEGRLPLPSTAYALAVNTGIQKRSYLSMVPPTFLTHDRVTLTLEGAMSLCTFRAKGHPAFPWIGFRTYY